MFCVRSLWICRSQFSSCSTNAWAAGEEAIKGSVSPGKLADLVVLDRDPFEVEPHELKDLRVMMTLVGGDVVYERSE